MLNWLSTVPWKYMGEWKYSSTILVFNTWWKWVVISMPWLLYPWERTRGTHRIGGWVDPILDHMWRFSSVIWQPPQLQKLRHITKDSAQGYVTWYGLEIVYDELKRKVMMVYLCYHVWLCQEEMLNITIKWELRITKILFIYFLPVICLTGISYAHHWGHH